MTFRRARSLIAVPLLLISMAGLFPAAARAGAGTESFVSLISQAGDYVDIYRFFDEENGSISITGDASYLTVRAGGGSRQTDAFYFEFAAPWGEILEVGEYEQARGVFQEAGRPGMGISGWGFYGCRTTNGRFRVNEITTDATGAVTSLWILYEHYCDGNASLPTIGEIRVDVAGDGGNVAIGPRAVRFAPTDPGAQISGMPFVVRNTGSSDLDLAASTLTGPSADEFGVSSDECSGQPLAPGAMCRVFVHWIPGPPGDKTAALVIPEADGPKHTIPLEGFVHAGRTGLVMESDPHDWIGRGMDWSLTPSNSRIGLGATDRHFGGTVYFGDDEYFELSFVAPSGETLTPGTTYQASRFGDTGARMDIGSTGRGCNTISGEFRVDQLDLNTYGQLERLSSSFEQYCDSYTHALRGVLEFRATSAEPVETTITSGPSGTVPSSAASFTFAASVADATFECSLDGSSLQPCTSPASYEGLTEGSHTFRVRAKSPDGRIDFTAAQRDWIVDAAGPQISDVRPRAGLYVNGQPWGETGPIVVVGSVTVYAKAFDAESSVPVVGFDVNGSPVEASKISRHRDAFWFTFRPPSPAQYTITVRAVNGSGVATTTDLSLYGVPTP